MIWIIGGTSETHELVEKLKGNKEYIITVATPSGKEVLEDERVLVSRLNLEEMINFIKDNNIKNVIDMSHPYAVEVSKNAREASKICNTYYFRYLRESADTKDAFVFPSINNCMEFLKTIDGCVFFTTGSKNIRDFENVRGENRFIYRVLPSSESIRECDKCGLKMQDVVAILGPVSEELNTAMFKEYGADYVVMKDSGIKGGTEEKIKACKKLGIIPIVIGRVDESGFDSIDKLLDAVNNQNYYKAEKN